MPTINIYGVPYNVPAPVVGKIRALENLVDKLSGDGVGWWVPTGIRPPDSNKTVNVRESDGYKHTGYYLKGFGWYSVEGRVELPVTHWCEIPEDPEGKDGPLFSVSEEE
jgi:hypothetical protein